MDRCHALGMARQLATTHEQLATKLTCLLRLGTVPANLGHLSTLQLQD